MLIQFRPSDERKSKPVNLKEQQQDVTPGTLSAADLYDGGPLSRFDGAVCAF